ncbi:MAG TPA: dNTP triphosphohydrolase [Devosia sp.]|nr:dNTP triphosphohydrolase [Devosia sp.]
MKANWTSLTSTGRLSTERAGTTEKDTKAPSWRVNSRTETERDFDRVLFATPTRRLADKTQVFPLEKNDSVRTRLTHSHEVADLARSIGTHLVNSPIFKKIMSDAEGDDPVRLGRAIPAILGAIGLAHDMGNPPFGHQGEDAMQAWVKNNSSELFPKAKDDENFLAEGSHRQDFIRFEGNAQTIRTLTRLQVVKDNRGLNLTFGTLAAAMKYTVGSDRVQKGGPAHAKKHGYFESEASLVREVRQAAGLGETDARHPLTFIMEACDDAAYLTIDAEDAIKKRIVSFADLLSWLEGCASLHNDELAQWVIGKGREAFAEVRNAKLSPSEMNDVAMQIFRAQAITAFVSSTIEAFENNYDAIMTGGLEKSLLDVSRAAPFAEELRVFDRERAYSNREVLKIELSGYNTLQVLMDYLWEGITKRTDGGVPASKRSTPFARYAYGRISENYRRIFEGHASASRESDKRLPIRYKELQLLTDMVGGMTDQFAIDLHNELNGFRLDTFAGR